MTGQSRSPSVPTATIEVIGEGPGAIVRFSCPCRKPAVLLATRGPGAQINIKVRDRYWHVIGMVRAVCPRCGAEHVLDPFRGDDRQPDRGSLVS